MGKGHLEDDKMASGFQNPVDLLETPDGVPKVPEPKGARHGVKGLASEREDFCVGLNEPSKASACFRRLEHRCREIQTDDPVRGDPLQGLPHLSGPSTKIQNPAIAPSAGTEPPITINVQREEMVQKFIDRDQPIKHPANRVTDSVGVASSDVSRLRCHGDFKYRKGSTAFPSFRTSK